MDLAGLGPPSGRPSKELVPVECFRALDFDTLWRGRFATTRLERAVLGRALAGCDVRRVLEAGTGSGRLSPVLRAHAGEYVGLDLNTDFLERIEPPQDGSPKELLVEGNLYRLPFKDGAFTTVVLARVFNFLSPPLPALEEIRRVLTRNGSLVVSYNPRPSWGTLMGDVKSGLSGRRGRGTRSMTFSRAEETAVHPSSVPAFTPTRIRFQSYLGEAGFHPFLEFGTGWEDSRIARAIPTAFYLAWGSSWSRAPGFPLRWAVATTAGGSAGQYLPFESILACPRCRAPWEFLKPGETPPEGCERCGFPVSWKGRVLRALELP